MNLLYRLCATPLGRLKLVASERGLVAVLWADDNPARVPLPACVHGEHAHLAAAEQQLQEYFAGARQKFSLPLDMRGTAFQQSVWSALQAIPFGQTRSYGALARQLGNAAATRAVGAANGRNPLSIIVPCHRVVGATGKMTGFAGGVAAKQYLLQLESASLFHKPAVPLPIQTEVKWTLSSKL